MKRTFTLILSSFIFLAMVSCGGKDMDSTPDFSDKGPNYFNSDYHKHADTNTVRTKKSFQETQDLSEPSLDSGSAGREKSIVRDKK